MKKLIYIGFIFAVILGCTATKSKESLAKKEPDKVSDTVRIANDELEYEILIYDPNFSIWLQTVAKPRNYYSLYSLENNNIFYVTEWNTRVNQPQLYNPNLYQFQIDYNRNIHYGHEVNYLLYNYFLYFQKEYKQKL